MVPSIGRIVHYWPSVAEVNIGLFAPKLPVAAIITFVFSEDVVNLTVFAPDGTTLARPGVQFDHGAGDRNDLIPHVTWPAKWEA